MRRYNKSDVKKHWGGYGWNTAKPAVNVKVHKWIDVPGCTEQAVEWALDLQKDSFWEYWTDRSGDYENGLSGSSEYSFFPGYDVHAEQEGRSGGWLVIVGLPEIEEWDAVLLGRWRKFEKAVLEDVKWRCSPETLREDIEANRWNEEGAQQYNFRDVGRGKVVCAADVYRMTHEYPQVAL